MLHKCVNSFATQHRIYAVVTKISLANFLFRITLSGRAEFVPYSTRSEPNDLEDPKIVEVPVGMEINMYACAARK